MVHALDKKDWHNNTMNMTTTNTTLNRFSFMREVIAFWGFWNNQNWEFASSTTSGKPGFWKNQGWLKEKRLFRSKKAVFDSRPPKAPVRDPVAWQ
jgi:hypothetical protein